MLYTRRLYSPGLFINVAEFRYCLWRVKVVRRRTDQYCGDCGPCCAKALSAFSDGSRGARIV